MALKLRNGVSTAEVEYGTALLDEARGEYWNLNPTGALVLRVLVDGGTHEDAAQAVVDEYDVDLPSAKEDVDNLITDLRAAGLVES